MAGGTDTHRPRGGAGDGAGVLSGARAGRCEPGSLPGQASPAPPAPLGRGPLVLPWEGAGGAGAARPGAHGPQWGTRPGGSQGPGEEGVSVFPRRTPRCWLLNHPQGVPAPRLPLGPPPLRPFSNPRASRALACGHPGRPGGFGPRPPCLEEGRASGSTPSARAGSPAGRRPDHQVPGGPGRRLRALAREPHAEEGARAAPLREPRRVPRGRARGERAGPRRGRALCAGQP